MPAPIENALAPSKAELHRGVSPVRFGPTRAEQAMSIRRRLALGAAGFALVCGPGLFGAVMPGPLMVLGTSLALGLLVMPPSRAAPPMTAPIWMVIAAFAVVLGVAVAQVMLFHLAGSGPAAWPTPFPFPTTVNVGATERAIGPLLSSLLAFLLGVQLASTPARAWRLIGLAAVIAMLWTCLTLMLFAIDPRTLLWLPKRAYVDSLTGPFVNRNTAAVYFGIGLSCFIAIFRQHVRDIVRPPTLARAGAARSSAVSLAAAAGILVLVVAIMLTRSRAGILLALLSNAGLVAILCLRSEGLAFKAKRPAAFWVLALLSLAAAALALVAMIDTLAQRGMGDGGRLSVYMACLKLISQQPIWGSGLGTFADVFPTVRPDELSSWGVWDRAHNTLLELAADVGLPAAGMTVLAAIVAFAALVKGITSRRRHYALPALGASIALLAGGHSLVDFSLQIPGLATMFFLILGACLAQAKPDHGVQHVSSPKPAMRSGAEPDGLAT